MLEEGVAAYVINRRVYKESSLLVDFFTLDHGKITLVAKGALRNKSDKAGLLQPFQPLIISYSGKSSLKTLRNVELSGNVSFLESDYLYCGYYLNELIERLLPREESSANLFGVYIRSINELILKKDQYSVLRLFEYTLLNELGLLPDFTKDASNCRIDQEDSYHYSTEWGFISHGVNSVDMASSYMSCFPGKVLLDIALSDSADSLSSRFSVRGKRVNELAEVSKRQYDIQAKKLMKVFVDSALNGQELKSRSLFKKISFD